MDHNYHSVPGISAHGYLNTTRDFGPHGCLSGIKIPYVCIEAATVAPWNVVAIWALAQEWVLARDSTVLYMHRFTIDLIIVIE